ncbi:MAG: ATP-binding cassette domain-containing protein [Granulosicoccaceae bacterium]
MNNEVVLDKVDFSYGKASVLSGFSWRAEPGKFTALLGPNGAGKSTVFNLIAGLLQPAAGEIRVGGLSMQKDPLALRRAIGVVFQQASLDAELTVTQNLRYFAGLHGLRLSPAELDEALQRLDLQSCAKKPVASLSGGLKRRVEIARALLHRPQVLIMDEPTAGLDLASKTVITDYAHELSQQGVSVIWITHLLDEIDAQDPVVIMRAGCVEQEGTLESLGGVAAVRAAFGSEGRLSL